MIKSMLFSSLGYGKISFEPLICFLDKTENYRYIVKEQNDLAHYYVINNILSDDIIIKNTQSGLTIKRVFKNNSDKIIKL